MHADVEPTEDEDDAQAPEPGADVLDLLAKLRALHLAGALSDDDFASKKGDLLSRL